jgi:ABC-type transporter Mla subunit MlaD
MADLESAADVALVKTKELSGRIDKAEAAFTELEDALEDAQAQFDADWSGLEEKARILLDLARAQAAGIGEEGEEAREALTQLDESLAHAASDWDGAVEGGVAETAALGAHVAEQQPLVASAGAAAAAAASTLAEHADPIEAQLQQALAEVRSLLETGVASELRELQESVRERAEALRVRFAEQCDTVLAEALAGWERQLAQVEDVIDEEFARARQHAADVVEFSLLACQRGHDEAWTEVAGFVEGLGGLLQGLGESVTARTAQLGDRRGAAEQALADVAAALERMRAALVQELETMARYEFVQR